MRWLLTVEMLPGLMLFYSSLQEVRGRLNPEGSRLIGRPAGQSGPDLSRPGSPGAVQALRYLAWCLM